MKIKYMSHKMAALLLLNLFAISVRSHTENSCVTIAIFAKDQAHILPFYLSCIENQTWPASKTYLYIRTYNNTDDTINVLSDWINRVWERYAGVFFDDSNVSDCDYFDVERKLKQEAIDWAREQKSHFFVVACNNFIQSNTLDDLLKTNLSIVAPLLRSKNDIYSDFSLPIKQHGSYAECPLCNIFLNQGVKGLIQVPIVYSSYLVRHEVLEYIVYDDQNSVKLKGLVIFKDSARKNNIPQYLDTRAKYGRISFAKTDKELWEEPWLSEFDIYIQ